MAEGKQLTVIIKGPASSKVGNPITFSARVVDGQEPIKIQWSTESTKTEQLSETPDIQNITDFTKIIKFPNPGSFIIHVDVTDNNGMTGEDSFLIYVEE